MPLYEYRCDDDGTVITLMRPMAEADAPVEDPDAKGRTFKRVFSSFAVGAEKSNGSNPPAPGPGSCCSCMPGGMCGL
jgi:putative FmdB family regulatory protein